MHGFVRWTFAVLAWAGCSAVGALAGALVYVAQAPSAPLDSMLGGLFVLPAYLVIGGIFGALAGGFAVALVLRALPPAPERWLEADSGDEDAPS